MKKTTAADVARACGVSQATVSYVLNDRPDKNISLLTREKILEAARLLNYYPDVGARSMRMKKAMSIGVVIGRDSLNLSSNQILRGVKDMLYRNGYCITLLPDDEPSDQAKFVSYYLSRRIDGLLFLYCTLDEHATELLGSHHIPYCAINEAGISGPFLKVRTGLGAVIRECAQYCRDSGLHRAVYIRYPHTDSSPATTRKSELLRSAMQEVHPDAVFHECIIDKEHEDDDSLRRQILSFMKQENPQIIFTPLAKLTLITHGCILHERLEAPMHIKLISLYDSRFFDMLYPSITHLEFPLSDMGGYACECLIHMLASKPFEEKSFVCSLHPGQSTLL